MPPIIVAYYSPIKRAITKKYIVVESREQRKDITELASIHGKWIKSSDADIIGMFGINSESRNIKGSADPTEDGEDEPSQDLFGDLDESLFEDSAGPDEFSIKEAVKKEHNVQQQSIGTSALLKTYSPSDTSTEITAAIKVYPFDRIYDLMLKIGIITSVPYYRLHADYIDTTGTRHGTYKLFAGGPYDTNILTYGNPTNSVSLGNGIFVDKYIYDIKSDAKVYVTDTFSVAEHVRYILISDLNELISQAPLDDQYKMDLVYYGLVLKYWPQVTVESFKDYVTNEIKLYTRYPELARDMSYIKSQYVSEKQLLGNLSDFDEENNAIRKDILSAIGRCLVTGLGPGPLNLRNIFDALSTNDTTSKIHVPEIHYFIRDGSKNIQLTKVHHGLKIRGVPNQQVLRTGLTAIIVKGSETMYFSMFPNGRWYFKAVFAEEDFMTFDKVEAFVASYVGPLVRSVNAIGLKGSPMGPVIIKDVSFEHISAGIFWKKILTDSQFKDLIRSIDQYVSAGIIGQYDIINTVKDSQLYIFKKGTYEFDGTLIDRVLIKAGRGELRNQFNYLVNPVVRSKWLELYSGRVIRVTHRSSDIYIEIQDAQQNEFNLFRKVMVHILRGAGIKETGNVSVKNNLDKSKEQDPVLFNLKKAGYPVVYARICQKKMQPIVYQESEYSALPDHTKKKLVKYKNFTYNKPAYYMCPGSTYKYLNFIAGVHPAGYCLPCCFKTPISDRERKAKQIFESCTQKFRGPDDLVSESRHILATNKILDPGRVGHLPESLKKIVPKDTYMYGTIQYVRSIFCPMLSVAAMVIQEIKGAFIGRQDPVDYFINELYVRLVAKGKIFMPDLEPDDLINSLGRVNKMQNDSVDWNNVITRALLVFWGITIVFHSGIDIDLPAAGSMTDKIVFVAKRVYSKESSVNNSGPAWYPICMIDQSYFKIGSTGHCVFSLKDDLDILYEALGHYDLEQNSKANKRPGADAIIEYLSKTSGNNKVKYTKYIGRMNKVYGILFEYSEGNTEGSKQLFVPVDYSDYASGKERVLFEEPTHVNDPETLKKFFESFELPGYLRFEVSNVLQYVGSDTQNKQNSFIGIIVNGLQCSHKPVSKSPFMRSEWNTETRIIKIDYDPFTVNNALLSGQKNIDDPQVSRALYKYYLYDLVLMQVTNSLQKLRDPIISERIKSVFSGAKYSAVTVIMKGLSDIVPRGSNDFTKMITAIEKSKKTGESFIATIMAERYSWDDEYMKKMFTQDHIRQVIAETTVRGSLKLTSFPNVYEPCQTETKDNKSYCNSGKLVVDCDDRFWNDLANNIVDDLNNPIKKDYLMDRLYYDNIIDEFSYNVGPNETLFIKKK